MHAKWQTQALLELAITKSLLNLRAEAARTYLSYTWWLLEPLMFIGIYYVVFGLLLQRGGTDYVVFLLVGVIHWLWFSKSVGNSTMSIVQGRGLISQVDIPKVFFPLVIVLQDFIKQIPVFILMCLFLIFYGIHPSLSWLMWPVLIAIQFLLVFAFAVIAAAIVPVMHDLRIVITTGLQLMMFLSGIFYSHTIIPDNYQAYFFANPMAKLIYLYREVLMYGHWPDIYSLFELVILCCILLGFSFFLIFRFDHLYSRLVLE